MTNSNIKETTSGIRVILYVAGILVLSVSITLYLFPEQTEVYFSWTINPPLTAVFLGAGYLAAFLLEFLSARERIWARARPAVPGVWAFTFLTLIVTLFHIDRFHFSSPAFITVAGTWVWLGIYIGVPVVMGLLWVHQIRQPGIDPPRVVPLPKWFLMILMVQGAIMLLFGSVMLIFPDLIIPIWPWKLSALTCRAIGAWGVAIGIVAVQATWENDWRRLFPAMLTYAVYGLLQVINILRFPTTLNWSSFSAIFYTIFVISIVLVGTFGAWTAWSIKQMDDSNIRTYP